MYTTPLSCFALADSSVSRTKCTFRYFQSLPGVTFSLPGATFSPPRVTFSLAGSTFSPPGVSVSLPGASQAVSLDGLVLLIVRREGGRAAVDGSHHDHVEEYPASDASWLTCSSVPGELPVSTEPNAASPALSESSLEVFTTRVVPIDELSVGSSGSPASPLQRSLSSVPHGSGGAFPPSTFAWGVCVGPGLRGRGAQGARRADTTALRWALAPLVVRDLQGRL